MSVMNVVRAFGVTVASILLFNGCGAKSSGSGSDTGTGTTATTAWTNTAMQSVVKGKCAIPACHNAAAGTGPSQPNYEGITEAKMKADSLALSQVQAGLMPQGSALTAAEKTTFTNFYK